MRGHEIDMFGQHAPDDPFPGVAVEMEWNNKDPFFDRDLINFQALHREGAIAAGIIVTRGPRLQALISPLIRSRDGGFKYGQSSTHWDKLIPRVQLGGGGECPLLLIGIEPEKIRGIELALRARSLLAEAETLRAGWRQAGYARFADVQAEYSARRREALGIIPPVADGRTDT